jgi:hypothetical protein
VNYKPSLSKEVSGVPAHLEYQTYLSIDIPLDSEAQNIIIEVYDTTDSDFNSIDDKLKDVSMDE